MGSDAATVAPVSEKGQRSRHILRRLAGPLIAVATLLLLLGGLELVGTLWERNTAQGPLGWTLVASRRMPLVPHGVDEQPYWLLEPGQDYNWEGIPVHINSRGFRGDEFEVPKPTGTYRILNVGDSVAFGWEVMQEDTYGQQLAAMLNERDDGSRYEVINAGVPGWNLETARNFLLQEGLSYQPDLILLDITVVNDIYGGGPGAKEASDLFAWLRDNTHAWPFLTTQARFLLARQRGPEAIPVLNPPRQAKAYYPLDDNSDIYDRPWRNIAEIEEAAQKQGIDFVAVAFPTALQFNSAAHPDVPQRVLAERAGEAGIPFLDLLPIYRQTCEEADSGACEGFENLLSVDVWMHPSPMGHQLAAQQIGDLIVEQIASE